MPYNEGPMKGSAGRKVWATLVTCKSYVPGCLVLLSSLRRHGSQYPLLVMVTPLKDDPHERLPKEYRDILVEAGCILEEIDYLLPASGGYTGAETRFVDTWTKLRVFGLSEYERIVLIDSDMLVRQNLDELFDMPLEEDWIAAVHACTCNPFRIPHYPAYWVPETCAHNRAIPAGPEPDALCTPFQPTPDSSLALHTINSGIVVLRPNEGTYNKLIHALHTNPDVNKYDFPDQDFIASEFKNRIKFLGYEYNATKHMRDCHKNLWRDDNIRICHYIFKEKPWVIPESGATSQFNEQFQVVHGWWWGEWKILQAEKEGAEWWGAVKALATGAS